MRRHDLFIEALSTVAEPRQPWPRGEGARQDEWRKARTRHWLVPLALLVLGSAFVAAI